MEGTAVVLIVVSGGDIASTNQAEVVRQLANWKVIDDVEGQPAHACNDVRMWTFPDGVLWEDNLDHRWQKATGEQVTEVIFHHDM